jgi:hypothetical protein
MSEKAWFKMRALLEDSKNEGTSIQEDTDENNEMELHDTIDVDDDQRRPDGFKVCAICCKEKALSDDNNTTEMDQEIDDQKRKMEQKLGRPLKLREQKAIERKVERAIEKEKQRAKEERRRLREEAAGKDERSQADASNSSQDEHSNEMLSDDSMDDDIHSEDEDDPFLKAIGGKEMLLTGEAYQKYLLQKRGELEMEQSKM